MSDDDRRSLRVKSGVVKRLCKELEMYEAEVEAEKSKVQKLRDAGADPHDIKYAVRFPAILVT
jgi:tubulin-specific chaperone A